MITKQLYVITKYRGKTWQANHYRQIREALKQLVITTEYRSYWDDAQYAIEQKGRG